MSDAALVVQAAIRACDHQNAGLCYRCAEKLIVEQTAALRAKLTAIESACWQDFAGGPDCCVFCGGRKPTHEAGCLLAAPEGT